MIDPAIHDGVVALMREVGRDVILPRFRALAAHERQEKTPGDFVTVADREAEARLTDGLTALLPQARVLGEEAEAANPGALGDLSRGVLWIVDPLDGTNNFAEGREPFAVMVALAVDGAAVAGWILDPVSGRLCHAERGKGAFVDGGRIAARRSGAALPQAAIALYFLDEARRADLTCRAAGRMTLVPIPRCAGEQYPRLALGQNDVALFERAHPWDHAAGGLFLTEAGGRLAHPDGQAYDFTRPRPGMIGAATPQLWDEAARLFFG